MKKVLIGFIAIGLLTFVGCKKEEDDTTDADGYTYKTVTIGEQEWFAENLKTSKYNDGTVIPNVTDDTEWDDLETGAWCNYNNSSSNDATYGKLYNWYAVNTSKLCPTGWHVPTDAEWTVLEDYLTANGHNNGTEGKEGTALKATSGWNNKDDGTSGNGTDDYGWNGLPGGCRTDDSGFFFGIGNNGYWWSSSQYYTLLAWYRSLNSNYDGVSSYYHFKEGGFSVRCIRD